MTVHSTTVRHRATAQRPTRTPPFPFAALIRALKALGTLDALPAIRALRTAQNMRADLDRAGYHSPNLWLAYAKAKDVAIENVNRLRATLADRLDRLNRDRFRENHAPDATKAQHCASSVAYIHKIRGSDDRRVRHSAPAPRRAPCARRPRQRSSRRARVLARMAGTSASTGDPDPEPPTIRRTLTIGGAP
jgi:hypothetical protein